MTTRNMPKISHAGTFCCTDEGLPPRGLPTTSRSSGGRRTTSTPSVASLHALQERGDLDRRQGRIREQLQRSPTDRRRSPRARASTSAGLPLRTCVARRRLAGGRGASALKPSPAMSVGEVAASVRRRRRARRNPPAGALPSRNTSLSASDMMTMNAAGIRNSTARPCTSRDSASHSFTHRASEACASVPQRAAGEVHEELLEAAALAHRDHRRFVAQQLGQRAFGAALARRR